MKGRKALRVEYIVNLFVCIKLDQKKTIIIKVNIEWEDPIVI